MRIILLYLFFIAATTCLHAQVVNIESSRMQSDTVGWMGSAGAGFELVKTTQKTTQINLRAHLQYKTQKDLWLILGNYRFLKTGGQNFIKNVFGHLRYNRKLNSWLRWEIFGQAQNNYVTKIKSRYLLGTGPRFKLADNRFFHLYIASLVMYEQERELTEPPIVHKDIRNSSYISFTIRPNDIVEIISTTFYQPLLKKFNDYRVLNESILKVRTGKHFSFTFEWNYLYDRFPAADAPQTNYDLAMGFQYDF